MFPSSHEIRNLSKLFEQVDGRTTVGDSPADRPRFDSLSLILFYPIILSDATRLWMFENRTQAASKVRHL
jgi:hypothetical protein